MHVIESDPSGVRKGDTLYAFKVDGRGKAFLHHWAPWKADTTVNVIGLTVGRSLRSGKDWLIRAVGEGYDHVFVFPLEDLTVKYYQTADSTTTEKAQLLARLQNGGMYTQAQVTAFHSMYYGNTVGKDGEGEDGEGGD